MRSQLTALLMCNILYAQLTGLSWCETYQTDVPSRFFTSFFKLSMDSGLGPDALSASSTASLPDSRRHVAINQDACKPSPKSRADYYRGAVPELLAADLVHDHQHVLVGGVGVGLLGEELLEARGEVIAESLHHVSHHD